MNTDNIRILEFCGWEWFTFTKNPDCRWLERPENNHGFWTPDPDMTLPIAGDAGDLVPDFSSLDACFEYIVPAMQARGLEVVISCPIDDAFRVQLFRVPSPIAEQSEQGDTPAKAIVAAALAYLDSAPRDTGGD